MPFGLLAALYFAVVFFGAAHVWSQSLLVLAISGTVCAALLIRVNGAGNKEPLPIIYDPPSLVGLLFVIWTAVQLIPLPPELLRIISPRALALWETTRIAGGTPPFTISLYPYMTAGSLVFAIAVLLFYWSALYGLRERRQISAVVMGLIVLGNLESLYAMGQLVAGMPYILWWKKTVSEEVATGTFIDRNHFAGFLSLLICLAVGYIWAIGKDTERGRRKRHLYGRMSAWTGSLGTRGLFLALSVALMTATLLTSASRGGVLSLLGGLVFMFGLVLTRYFRTGKAAVFLIAVLAGLIFTGYIASDRVLERFHYFSRDLDSRLARAHATIVMGEDFPHTGAGLGAFEFVFPRYQKDNVELLIDYAHNDWAQLFAETGWPGVLILGGGLIWFMGVCIGRWRQRHDPFSVGIGLGGMGAFIAIALHSLSEFNLHMPANALLLALIAALLFLALHAEARAGRERFTFAPRRFALTRLGVFLLAVTVIWGEGTLAVWVVRQWRADTLARTVWNSTIPASMPSDEELVRAWRLAPGNAAYGNMIAARLTQRSRITPPLQKEIRPGEKDADTRFLKESVRKNPTSWITWRNLGWNALLKSVADPVRYLPLARYSFERARVLRPYAALGHFEYGMAGLLAASLQPGKTDFAWKEAFRTALAFDPGLAFSVTDQLVLHFGHFDAEEAAILKELLPADPRSYHRAADYLIRQGFPAAGLELLKEEQQKRDSQTAVLWREYRQRYGGITAGLSPGVTGDEERAGLLKRIIAMDPRHPFALLARDKILDALKSQERKGQRLGELGDLKALAASLNGIEQPNASPAEIAYFMGRLAEEGGNYPEAAAQFRKARSLSPSHFPALLRLQALGAGGKLTGEARSGDERLEEQIRFYAMEGIRTDAWRWTGLDGGLPSWTAPFRTARGLKEIVVRFAGDGPLVSELLLDGHFVDGWNEAHLNRRISIAVPPGEHILRISQYREPLYVSARIVPFELQVEFVFLDQ